MILIAGVVVWLLCFLFVTFTPRPLMIPGTRRNAQSDLLALLALGILTAGFFWQLLFTSNTFMPAGGGDLAGFLYPTYRFAQEWLTRGIIPLWNPFIFGGMPFIGDIQSALFYPPNLITYFLSNPLQYRDLEYLSVFHFYLAGAGMFALLRYGNWTNHSRKNRLERRTTDRNLDAPTVRGLNLFACLAGAVAFEFSDLFITHFGNLNLIASAAWLPVTFLFFACALQNDSSTRNQVAFAAVSGIFLALSFFAGHVQPFLFVVLTLVLFAGYSIAVDRARWNRIALSLLVTLGIGVGLSAITFLPALELTQLSVRGAFTYQDAAQYSLPPIELIGIFVPGFFGRGPLNAWGPWARVEVGYIGILPLLLALCAVILRRSSRTMFLVLLALTGLLLSLGGYAILHGWLFQFVPGFGQLRAPARFVFLMDFGLAILAAIGFDALGAPLTDAAKKIFHRLVKQLTWISVLIVLAAGALALGILILGQGQDPALFQRIANAANSIGFFVLLLVFSIAMLLVRAREWLSVRAWSALALGLIFFDLFSLGAYVDIGSSDPTLGYQRPDVVEFLKNNLGIARIDSRTDVEGVWRPDTGLLYSLQDVYGDNPLVLDNFNTYWAEIRGRDDLAYNLLNAKYVLTRRDTPMPSNFSRAFDGGGGITVWENHAAAPRAWLTADPRIVPNGIELTGAPANAQAVSITGYGPNEIRAQVNAPQTGYLVFSEVFVPGWRAFVDQAEVPLIRANDLFRALPISAGTHQVQLIYSPLSFRMGTLISGVTILIALTALSSLWFLRRQ